MRRDPRSATMTSMSRGSRRLFGRFADFAIPWGTGLFLVLVVLDEGRSEDSSVAVLAGLLLVDCPVGRAALAPPPARARHRGCPGDRGRLPALYPEVVVPSPGLFAVGSLAAARPPRQSLVGLAGPVGAVAPRTSSPPPSRTPCSRWRSRSAPGRSARRRATAAWRSRRRRGAPSAEEQARIARELHDVIAHSVSVIVVQAAAADDVFDDRPDQARAALRSIERAGRDALARAAPAARRRAAGGGGDPPTPQPGLDRLDELAEPLRAGGLDVVVRREGAPARRCPRASTCPPTGSSRRRSPTRCATPAPPAPR